MIEYGSLRKSLRDHERNVRSRLGPVYTTPENWKRCFHSENASNVFRPHYAGEIKTQQSPAILDLCFRGAGPGKSRDYCDVLAFQNFRFKMFSVHTKTQRRCFQISPPV